MKVVVTGGSGNIGRYVVRELLQYGHEIVSFDRVVPPEPEPGAHYRLGDHEDEGAPSSNSSPRLRPWFTFPLSLHRAPTPTLMSFAQT